MVNTVEKNIVAEWDLETGKNVIWRASLGSQSYGNPIIHEGKVFVGTNNGAEYDKDVTGDKGNIVVFDEATGEFLWQVIHDKLPSGRVNDWPEQGICSTLTAEGDRIWYISNECTIVCADTEGFTDGENDGPYTDEKYSGPQHADFIWVYDMMDELGVFPHNLATSSPLVVGDRIFVITSNGVDEGHLTIPSPRSPSFIALDKNTGELLWESALPGRDILHGQWSSATYGDVNGQGQVYMAGGDGWLYALNPADGELIWKFDLNPKDSIWELGGRGTRNNIISTPVFVENVVYLAVGQDPEHGIGDGHFYAIDATKTGDVTETAVIWHYGELTRTPSSAAVIDDRVYIAELNGFLYCLDRATGEKLWDHDTLAAIWGSPTVIDGKVYLGDEDGDVVILEDSRVKKLLGEFTVENSAYTTPVAANGRLYIANRSEVFALGTEGE
jgi:outer membrane protein assembly factor BamB